MKLDRTSGGGCKAGVVFGSTLSIFLMLRESTFRATKKLAKHTALNGRQSFVVGEDVDDPTFGELSLQIAWVSSVR